MGFFQDEFKVAANLTLNLGLRYEYYSVMHEILDRSAVVDIYGCGGFCPKGTPYYSPDYNNFGPRIGLAWTPGALGGKTTSGRASVSITAAIRTMISRDPAESAVPRYSLTSADYPNLGYPLTAFLNPENQFYSPKAIDRNRKDLYYENWSFVIEQQLPASLLLQTSYVGGEGHHLFDKYQVNLHRSRHGQAAASGLQPVRPQGQRREQQFQRAAGFGPEAIRKRAVVPGQLHVVARYLGLVDRVRANPSRFRT